MMSSRPGGYAAAKVPAWSYRDVPLATWITVDVGTGKNNTGNSNCEPERRSRTCLGDIDENQPPIVTVLVWTSFFFGAATARKN